MPRLSNNLEDLKQDLSFYFEELAYAFKNMKMHFTSAEELIHFAVLDILTNLFYSQKDNYKKLEFLSYLKEITQSLETHHAASERSES